MYFLLISPSFRSVGVSRSANGSHYTPCYFKRAIPSSKVILTTGYLHLKGSNSNCSLIALSSLAYLVYRPLKIKGKSSPKKSKISK